MSLRATYEQHQRFVVARNYPGDLPLAYRMRHISELFTTRITTERKSCDMAAE